MKDYKFGFVVFFLVVLCLLSGFTPLTSKVAERQADLQRELTEKALASLRDEYDLLTTGNRPGRKLVPQSDRTTRRRYSGDERLTNTSGRRDHAIRDGRPYTNVDVNLQPHAVKEADDTIILEATEEVALHFTSTKHEPNPGRDVTRMVIEHEFVFAKSLSAASTVETESYHAEVAEPEYLLVADESPDPNTDESTIIYPSEQSTYPSTYGSPQSIDCGSCSINSRPYNYNGSYAGDYASTFAHSSSFIIPMGILLKAGSTHGRFGTTGSLER